jgi:hypothetical protein
VRSHGDGDAPVKWIFVNFADGDAETAGAPMRTSSSLHSEACNAFEALRLYVFLQR